MIDSWRVSFRVGDCSGLFILLHQTQFLQVFNGVVLLMASFQQLGESGQVISVTVVAQFFFLTALLAGVRQPRRKPA
jgi:hypothetical protein